MNKKILISLSVMGVVAAIAVGGTIAYFSDTETSTGNTFTAGSIDLKIDNESYYNGEPSPSTSWELRDLTGELFFNFADLKPGDWGEDTVSLHVDNNPAWGCVDFYGLVDDDNSCTEPEVEDGDIGCPSDGGELSQYLEFAFWADVCNEPGVGVLGDNIYQLGCDYPLMEGSAYDVLSGAVFTLAAPGHNNIFTGAYEEPLDGKQNYYIGKVWCFGDLVSYANGNIVCDGSLVNNIPQSDSLTGNVKFYVEQEKNNNNFSCY